VAVAVIAAAVVADMVVDMAGVDMVVDMAGVDMVAAITPTSG